MQSLLAVLTAFSYVCAALYCCAVAVLAIYGLHSLWLLRLFLVRRQQNLALAATEEATPLPADADLPRVLIQLPVFNERDVVDRLVDAVGRIDWPTDRLHIQLLDDSTDDSVEIGRAAVARLRRSGLDAVSIHRTDRTGYKAGALEHGLAQCDAPFIAIFDADFVPQADFLRKAIKPLLADPQLGLVQGRWEHLNRDQNLLTAAQALGIDGHFAIEQGARAWSGLFMNFNGTCGLWRREAIIAGGGWEHDTLTEDMDLSYRSQLHGWRCTYRLDLAVPGEIPASLSAWRSQQFRWAKGSIQTAIKLMPRVMAAKWPMHAKLAAFFHMTHYSVHPLILLSLFTAPPALLLAEHVPRWLLMFGLLGFLVGAGAPLALYAASQFVLRGWGGLRRLRVLPALAAIGTGIAISNSIAVWEALIGRQSAFVRTPKQGTGKGSYKASAASGIPELLCAGWAIAGLSVSIAGSHRWIAPLMLLYISGFLWVAWFSLKERAVAIKLQLGARSPLPSLIPAGLAAVTGVALLAAIPGGWQAAPVLFAAIALGLGALWLVAVSAVQRRPGGAWTLAWILLVTIALRVTAFQLPVDPAAHRVLVEGRQVASGQNPYLIAPAHPDTFALVGDGQISEASYTAVEQAAMTSTNPPLMLWIEALITQVSRDVVSVKIIAAAAELVTLALAMALLIRLHLPPAMIIVAAWQPLGPLFATGGGHLDSVMSVLLLGGVLLACAGRGIASILLTTAATLVRPLAAPALLPQLAGRHPLWCLLPIGTALVAYLPFANAALNLGNQVIIHHFNGPLASLVHATLEPWMSSATAHLATVAVIGAIFLAGIAWWHQRSSRDARNPAQTAALIAWLLVCLPTLQPWYLLALVPLLPITRSWGLLIWMACAPLWYLHPLRPDGSRIEILAITLLANLPPLAVAGWELLGRPWPRVLRPTVEAA